MNFETGAGSPVLIDTEDTLLIAKGGGTLRDPSISVIGPGTIAQIGAATVLGVFAGPLAAIPFIEPGLGEDAPCGLVLARAENSADETQ